MGDQAANRPDMVEAAKKFMLTPKVKDTPFEEQLSFLLGKGDSDRLLFLSFAQSAAIIGCVSYAGYRFMRSFVLPRFFDIPDPASEELRQLQLQVNELQNSIKFVLDSISQTTTLLTAQQQDVNRALLSVSQRDTDISRVEDGISTIKSLLLSHNNFAPIIAPTAVLPSWQQADSSSKAAVNSGYSTPPANYRDTSEELESEEAASSDRA
ncbi:unnamed protein product [Nippostrongylus brasiliensis]|uniref:Pex14_N domain-containing protein n=1 Tax=Nippostrongylus brasiliensis TaxID=27835 RepID=A0A158QZK0_NIPBR|nr:unnamed protein product [Nippostrongylus brasiliensis]